eukprot:1048738-Rhodomonas_salina.1
MLLVDMVDGGAASISGKRERVVRVERRSVAAEKKAFEARARIAAKIEALQLLRPTRVNTEKEATKSVEERYEEEEDVEFLASEGIDDKPRRHIRSGVHGRVGVDGPSTESASVADAQGREQAEAAVQRPQRFRGRGVEVLFQHPVHTARITARSRSGVVRNASVVASMTAVLGCRSDDSKEEEVKEVRKDARQKRAVLSFAHFQWCDKLLAAANSSVPTCEVALEAIAAKGTG